MSEDLHEAVLPEDTAGAVDREVAEFIRRGRDLHESGRFDKAIEEFELALALAGDNREAVLGHNRAVRRHVPRWHWEMLHDKERADLYDRAIRQVVRPDRLVLDIGTGTGLLSMMAARAGAREVIACEGQPAVAAVAEQIIHAAGHHRAITVVPKRSTAMRVPEDMPARADILITETIDCALLGEGILGTIAHAREHLLKEDALILPSAGRVFAQLVESDSLFRKNHVGDLYGFDLSEFNRLASLEYFDSRLRNHRWRPLSEPMEIFAFDFYRDGPEERRAEFVVSPTAEGRCHAIVFWFELDLVPGIGLTNSPGNPESHWKQAVQCLPDPLQVTPGEPLLLEARHDEASLHFTAVGMREATS
ncbi:50S ribosomal protein L11 methyltransferase [Actinomadura harenae]|uniref:SAM-dependent methyltransferase n=1 Tax=Actinomadura harenae TaxID=2483351 RepID=A0A3M2MCJ4_9ACTN|nr:50S ribosomal protein L11 methyltransferase [Actinomadura harenae]RMI47444.1 SAM-dependent methyltransferase [Actinomadura harenae]